MNAYLSYKNIEVAYSVNGKGPAVVLLHGFLENRKMWSDLVDELSGQYRVVCIDLLGHGETGILGYIHTMSDQATMIKSVLDHLRLKRYIVLGHSMGGYIALEFAKRYGNHLKGLCLMNSTALPDSTEKKKNRDRAIAAVRQNYNTFVKLAVPLLFSEKTRRFFKSEIKTITKEALKMSPRSIVAALKGMKERESRIHIYEKNNFPIMLIAGENDPALDYHTLVAQIKNTSVQFISFPDGHMSHIENRRDFLNTIVVFFRYCSRK